MIIATIFVFQFNKDKSPKLIINNKAVSLTIADNEEERHSGFGGVDSISDNQAMLFVFDKPDQYGFWMKDMKFPIDIVWLNENKEIIFIKENVSPDTYPNTFIPSSKALFVIEFNAGFVSRNNIKVGNLINF